MTELSGWNTAKTYLDETTLDVLFEGGVPVRACTVDTEECPAVCDKKDIQDAIQNAFGIFVHVGDWHPAENDQVVASLSVDKE
jgi:hypothetical protein